MHGVHSGFLKLAVTASVLLWASIAVTPAKAELVTFNFSGPLLTGVPALLTVLSLPANPTLVGSLTYESSSVGGSGNGTYSPVITAVNLNLGSGAYTTGTLTPQIGLTPNSIKIESTLQSGVDLYTMTAPISNGPNVGGFFPSYFELKFVNAPGVFSNNNVPTIGGFSSTPSFRLNFLQLGGSSEVNGSINTLAAVPLPPAVILFGAGLVALIGLGARNWQQKGNNLA